MRLLSGGWIVGQAKYFLTLAMGIILSVPNLTHASLAVMQDITSAGITARPNNLDYIGTVDGNWDIHHRWTEYYRFGNPYN